jgi:hypothetical protein
MDQSKNKTWRVNVIVSYLGGGKDTFSPNYFNLLKGLAFVHRLDCALDEDYSFSLPDEHDEQKTRTYIYDVVHFRSTDRTKINAKDFRQLIGCIFRKSPWLFDAGVDVGVQLSKVLPQFPFPE